MALDENKASQDEKDANQADAHSVTSSEKAEKLFTKLCLEAHSGQAEYFLNVYWEKYGKDHKDEIFGIFDKFAQTDEQSSDVTMNQVW